MFEKRLCELGQLMFRHSLDVAVITDDDSVYYLTGYYDYLHMEFGRPTLFIATRESRSDALSTTLITPNMEADMATAAACVDDIVLWNDGVGEEWRSELPRLLGHQKTVGIEPLLAPSPVLEQMFKIIDPANRRDISPLISQMRMIKSAGELQLARHAAEVANAMMNAARDTIADGVAEFEVALATSQAGTRTAARLLSQHYSDVRMSPNTHFLQIMASGAEITMPHRRATTKIIKSGEPVFMCFCGMTNFHRFKLGFDRTFWVGSVADAFQQEVYEVTVASQAAALACIQPGVTAEDVHSAYADVIQEAGYEFPFRCGRATGFSFLENPQLVAGDKTVLQAGMVLAVDGCVSVPNRFRAQVGDSIVVTDSGYEKLTSHPLAIAEVTL